MTDNHSSTNHVMPAVGLPYLPLNPRWMQEHPCFLSADPKLVRACINMLVAASRNAPQASISASYESLAFVTGLTERELTDNFHKLTHGWELRNERMVHTEMQSLCDAMWARHGAALDELSVDLVSMAQSPDAFELTSASPESSTKGRRKLPKNWRPLPETLKELAVRGFVTPEEQDAIIAKMTNWALSKAEKKNNWDATLLNFADKDLQWNPRPVAGRGVVPFVPGGSGSRFGALMTSKGEAARNANKSIMASLRNRDGS